MTLWHFIILRHRQRQRIWYVTSHVETTCSCGRTWYRPLRWWNRMWYA